jgi:hypothetical protein
MYMYRLQTALQLMFASSPVYMYRGNMADTLYMADAARDAVLLLMLLCRSPGQWKNKQARRVVPARFSVPLRFFLSAVLSFGLSFSSITSCTCTIVM